MLGVVTLKGATMRTLIRGAQELTQDPKRPVIKDGAMLVEGESIVAVEACQCAKTCRRNEVIPGISWLASRNWSQNPVKS